MDIKKNENRQKLEKVVKEFLADYFNVVPEKINNNSRLIEDLGMDSFAAVEFKFLLEKKFKIKIDNSELASIASVEDIIKLLENRIKD